MKKLIEENKYEDYLNFCSENRFESLEAAKEMFNQYYNNLVDNNNAWTDFNSKAEEARKNGNAEEEKRILKSAIDSKVDTPATYDRLALLLEKERNFEDAKKICEIWFDSLYWKIPNMAKGSLRILKRWKRLKQKVEK